MKTSVSKKLFFSIAGVALFAATAIFAAPPRPADNTPVNWVGVDLTGGNYSGVQFQDAARTFIVSSYGENVNFSGAKLYNTYLTNNVISNSTFENANLSVARFTRSSLSNVNFNGANISNANFTATRLTDIDFSGATLGNLGRLILTEVKALRLNVSGLNLSMSASGFWNQCSVTDSNFQNVNLGTNVLFSNSAFTNTDFRGATATSFNLATFTNHNTLINYPVKFRNVIWTNGIIVTLQNEVSSGFVMNSPDDALHIRNHAMPAVIDGTAAFSPTNGISFPTVASPVIAIPGGVTLDNGASLTIRNSTLTFDMTALGGAAAFQLNGNSTVSAGFGNSFIFDFGTMALTNGAVFPVMNGTFSSIYAALGSVPVSIIGSGAGGATGTLFPNNGNLILIITKAAPVEVTFVFQDGVTPSVTTTQEVDTVYSLPPSPSRTGYDFTGWFSATSGGTPVTTNTTIINTSSHNVYAQWTARTNITVTFSGNGGSPTQIVAQTFNSGYKLPVTNPTRTGYNFSGWATTAGGGTPVTTGITVTNAGSHTVYAQWAAVSYSIAYSNLLDGTHSGNPASYTIESATITFVNPTRTGYTGTWSPASIPAGSTGNQSITAVWTPIKYTVTFDINAAGVTGASGTPAPRSIDYNSVVGAVTPPSATSHMFAGWAKGSPMGGAIANIATEVVTGTVTYYALWTINSYTVTFNGGGGTLSSGTETQTVNYGASASAPVYTRTGYSFTGWDKPLVITSNTSITAQWAALTNIAVTFSGNGGSPTQTVDQIFSSGYKLPVTNPTRIGYDFAGWATTGGGGTPVTTSTIVTNPLAHTVYAQWTQLPGWWYDSANGTIFDETGWRLKVSLSGTNIVISSNATVTGAGELNLTKPVNAGAYTITAFENHAFYENRDITSVLIPESITSISDWAFGITLVTNATLPSTLTNIGSYAFHGCSELSSVEIPEGVTSIEEAAFTGCHGLITLVLPSTITNLGARAFSMSYQLQTIVIPEGITVLNDGMFTEDSSLVNVTLPSTITSIGAAVFMDCANLASIVIPASVTSIGGSAFLNTSIPWLFFGGNAPALPTGNLMEESRPVYYLAGVDDSGWGTFKGTHTNTVPLGSQIDAASIVDDAAGFQFDITGSVLGIGIKAVIEATDILTPTNWSVVATNVLPDTYLDPAATNKPSRFYRTRVIGVE